MTANEPGEMTCGKGVARNGELPAQMADAIEAIANVLEHHMTALPIDDANARLELEGYSAVVARARTAESALHDLADEMRAKRNLPTAPHDMAVLTAPAADELFRALIRQEGNLLAMLERRQKEHAELSGDRTA